MPGTHPNTGLRPVIAGAAVIQLEQRQRRHIRLNPAGISRAGTVLSNPVGEAVQYGTRLRKRQAAHRPGDGSQTEGRIP